MASNTTPTPESSNHSPLSGGIATAATVGLAPALKEAAALPQAFQQYPYGTAMLLVLVGIIAVAWCKNPRK